MLGRKRNGLDRKDVVWKLMTKVKFSLQPPDDTLHMKNAKKRKVREKVH